MSALDDAQATFVQFSDHLATCTDCTIKLDGTGDACPTGEALEYAARWDLEARGAELAAQETVNREAAALLAFMDACSGGGSHVGGTGGWSGICVKCGQPC